MCPWHRACIEAIMTYERHVLGRAAEDEALRRLIADGAALGVKRELICRNYRCKAGEVDLILEEVTESDRRTLVFVEVRARSRAGWVSGVESVDRGKRRRIQNAIAWFLAHRYRGHARELRVDVMALDGSEWTHLPNAWWSST